MSEPADKPAEEVLWAGRMGERWLAHVDRFEAMLAPIGQATIAKAAFAAGEHVVDLGCGAGATSLEIARLVQPGGTVTGLDISPALVAAARARATAAAQDNARFVTGDAAKAELDPASIDCLFSRFGNMFFADPVAAFTHLRTCLKPSGRVALACWGPIALNPWMRELRQAVARHVEMPPPVPNAPGPFAFEDQEYLRGILGRAGFGTAEFELWQGKNYIGGPGSDPESAAGFMMQAMSTSDALADQTDSIKRAAYDDVKALLARHHDAGGVHMAAAAWLVTARA
jgi:SAM-dependent methyltransferase